jgi:hypothetical protein
MVQGSQALQLRDIHLPDSVSWWPPAPGYWLILIIIALLLLGVWLFLRWRRQQKLKRVIQDEFRRIERDFQQSNDALQLTRELSVLLRRVSLACFPNTGCESMVGEHWLSFLDQQLQDSYEFVGGVGQILVTAPYSKQVDVNAQGLLALCQRWIGQAYKMRQSGLAK